MCAKHENNLNKTGKETEKMLFLLLPALVYDPQQFI